VNIKMGNINIPTTDIGGDEWVLLGRFGKKFIFRAESITKANQRVTESPSNHRFDQAVAEGSVKFRPKVWNISTLKG